jgi:hypothetical protein
MIVADHPNLRIGLKRKELVCGQRYVIKEKVRAAPGQFIYRHVFLVDLIAGNRAVIQWDEVTHDKPIGQPNRKIVTRVRTAKVSCSMFLATEEDWDRFPKHWNAKRRRLEIDYTEIQGEQATLGDMDALRRGHTLEVKD